MNFTQFALHMYPYWIVGILIICLVLASNFKDLVRIDKTALKKWVLFLVIMTSIRFLLFKLLVPHSVSSLLKGPASIPPLVGLTVFWEDAVHGLPLLILRKLIGVKKWTKPLHAILLGLVMFEFGLGHVYQGGIAAAFLSLYVPYSIKLAKKYGFGTVGIGHMLYDIFTIMLLKFL
jgi:hypothetical protein